MASDTKQYSLPSNIGYVLRLHWRAKRSTLIFCALAVVVSVALSFGGMLMPKLVVDALEAGVSTGRFLAVVGGFSLLMVLLDFLGGYTTEIYTDSVGTIATHDGPLRMLVRSMTMDYEMMESPDVKRLEEKALRAMESNHRPANNIPRTLVLLGINVLSFLLYGGIIASIHPLLLGLLVLSALINWWFLSAARRYAKSMDAPLSAVHKKLEYISHAVERRAGAKDIRLYGMAHWMRSLHGQVIAQGETVKGRVAGHNMRVQLVDAGLALLRDGAAYAYLTALLLRGELTLGNFVFVFAAIGAFAGWVSGILLQTNELLTASRELSYMRAFVELPDRMNTGPGTPLPTEDQRPVSITLRDVSYRYPEAQSPALDKINLDIRPGERIAVVGANGAGKTTLVKLICGLYAPQEGAVLLNGTESGRYNRDAYYTLFSTVFQDIHLLTCDIAGNVSQRPPEETDGARVNECLRLAGLYDKVQTLPQREHTLLVRDVNEDAVELSGGELQKLALARALYKDAPVIILDEPTAALDPIAESEIYERYAALTEGKTSVYISHRLASTRFCDRIVFLGDHAIGESGTHAELMALGGAYAHMFEIQSQYYQKNGEVPGNV